MVLDLLLLGKQLRPNRKRDKKVRHRSIIFQKCDIILCKKIIIIYIIVNISTDITSTNILTNEPHMCLNLAYFVIRGQCLKNRRELYQTRISRRHVRPAALHQMTCMCIDSCSTTALTPNTGKAANDAHMHILVKMSSVKPSKGVWLNIYLKKMEWRTVRLTYAHQKDGQSWL